MKFEYNGFSADVPSTNVAYVRRCEAALGQFYKDVADVDMTGMASDIYDSICTAAFTFLDAALGDGASARMFGDERDAVNSLTAVSRFSALMNDVDPIRDALRALGA